uniref:Uncharacterized protein n=1 Tax=Cacopsylla melanoneura TaxID=428564 RepID=A0A8D8VM13_9HEMI
MYSCIVYSSQDFISEGAQIKIYRARSFESDAGDFFEKPERKMSRKPLQNNIKRYFESAAAGDFLFEDWRIECLENQSKTVSKDSLRAPQANFLRDWLLKDLEIHIQIPKSYSKILI